MRHLISYSLGVAVMALAGCAMLNPNGQQERAAMIARMKAVTIPKLVWHETPVEDAFRSLEKSSGATDQVTPKICFRVRTTPAALYLGTITFSSENITLYQAFHLLEEMYDMSWIIEDHTINVTIRGLRSGECG